MRRTTSTLLAVALAAAGGAIVFQSRTAATGTFSGAISGGSTGGTGGGGGVTIYSWTATFDFPAFLADECQEQTEATPGVLANSDPLVLANPGDLLSVDAAYLYNVASYADGTITVRMCCNRTIGCSDPEPTNLTFKAVR